jgi:uncharacterized membrane protein YgdD (TMEM256/DUF423 family)
MVQTWKAWVSLGALNGLIADAAGAYAAHWLKAADPVLANAFQTGVDYQIWHALALLAVAWLAERTESAGRKPWLARLAGLAFVLGIALFSGTLYVFGASGKVWMSGAAPAGGALLMAGWVLLALSPIGGRAH